MGCIAAKIPIIIYEGGTFDKSFIWKSGNPPEQVDLTGYTARMAVRVNNTDATPLISLTEKTEEWVPDGDSGIYISEGGTGEYRIYINDEDTSGICAEHVDIDGVYDLFLETSEGESVLKLYGKAKLIAAVAR